MIMKELRNRTVVGNDRRLLRDKRLWGRTEKWSDG